jgi:ATP-dependent RNA helicase SUPV3L1/SUV3
MILRSQATRLARLGPKRYFSLSAVALAKKKRTTASSRKLLETRANKWITGEEQLDYSNHLTIDSVAETIDTLNQDKRLRDAIEAALFKLKVKARGNTFVEDRFKKNKTSALRSFEHDVSVALCDLQLRKTTLAELILPTAHTLPSTVCALRTPDDTINKFFKSKDIGAVSEQIDYLFETAYHHHLRSVTTQRTEPQDLTVSISNPAEWYPAARRLKRKIILHVGPTNSGKTYNALQRLRESNNGLYAGPLRLLAREVYHRFKSEGLRCNLVTGEEVVQDLDEFGNKAPLSCSTVEMVDLNTEFEVAVIDEIQMIGDKQRGWAWTNALMGVRAQEVHLCGEASIVDLVKKISEFTGDEVVVKEYKRLGRLKMEDKHLINHLSDLKKGDCVVVFSKKRILKYKADIERQTKLKAGVIYGALPAETRTEQARKFNEGEYDVLVASDAIGMGLNLRIKRVIFDNHNKFNGAKMTKIPIPHIKQIGGRAGRYKVAPSSTNKEQPKDKSENNDDDNVGYVSAFTNETLKNVDAAMKHDTVMVKKAILWPSDEVWSHYISEFPNDTLLSHIMQKFKDEVAKSKIYEIAEIDDRLKIVKVLEHVKGMLLTDMLRITTAPVGTRLPDFEQVLYGYGLNVSRNQTKSCFDFDFLDFSLLNQKLWDVKDLSHLENLHKYLMIWLWMNNRYPELFVNRETAVDAKNLIEERIEETLSYKDAYKQHGKN